MAKPRRIRWEVLPSTKEERDAGAYPWKVTREGEALFHYRTKAAALELAVTTARNAWRNTGQRGAVLVKGRDGRIQEERTYGADPTTTKG